MAGYVGPDESINVTVVNGLTWVGRAAPDGSLNVIVPPATPWIGQAHPCGAATVTETLADVNTIAAPNGSMYVSETPYFKGSRRVTVVSGAL